MPPRYAPSEPPEHFVTLFDHRFLPQGLALHESLRRHRPGARLWVLCVDEEAERQLALLGRPGLSILPLRDVETASLRAARRNRSRVDHLFTLTPFVYDFVFDADPSVDRLTYVDADIFFFKPPGPLFRDLEESGRGILLTEHGFAPEFAGLEEEFGRFCVQFLPVSRNERCLKVIRHWQRQCLECCTTALSERGRIYGDQKYLDAWPELYPDVVRVSPARAEMLGPWNVDYRQSLAGRRYAPIFYHFHSFRIFHRRWVQLCSGFQPRGAGHLYAEYLAAVRGERGRLDSLGIPAACVPFSGDRLWLPRLAWRCLRGRALIRPLQALDAA